MSQWKVKHHSYFLSWCLMMVVENAYESLLNIMNLLQELRWCEICCLQRPWCIIPINFIFTPLSDPLFHMDEGITTLFLHIFARKNILIENIENNNHLSD